MILNRRIAKCFQFLFNNNEQFWQACLQSASDQLLIDAAVFVPVKISGGCHISPMPHGGHYAPANPAGRLSIWQ
jgi:hypothetical protein